MAQAAKSKNVVPLKPNLPSWASKMDADAGKGLSQKAEDNLIPMARILQSLSPQCLKQKPEYIPGAEAGFIFVRGAPQPIINGDEGMVFQPVHFCKKWVEWVPRDAGGGLVERYDEMPADATMHEERGTGKKTWIRPNGNEVIETRYHTGIIHLPDGGRFPVVLPLSSTGHSFSKEWMLSMNLKKTPSGGKAPSYGYLYRLTTIPRSNAKGDWFVFKHEDLGAVELEQDYDAGRDLYNAVSSGEKQYDEVQEHHVEDQI